MTNHRINRLQIEIQAGEVALAEALAARMSRLHTERMVPLLDRACGELSGDDEPDRLECVEVDLGTLSADEFEADFIARLEEAFRVSLATALRSRARSRPAQASLELLETFALTGCLPWWEGARTNEVVRRHFVRAMDIARAELAKVLRRLTGDPGALDRLARACDPEVVAVLAGGEQVSASVGAQSTAPLERRAEPAPIWLDLVGHPKDGTAEARASRAQIDRARPAPSVVDRPRPLRDGSEAAPMPGPVPASFPTAAAMSAAAAATAHLPPLWDLAPEEAPSGPLGSRPALAAARRGRPGPHDPRARRDGSESAPRAGGLSARVPKQEPHAPAPFPRSPSAGDRDSDRAPLSHIDGRGPLPAQAGGDRWPPQPEPSAASPSTPTGFPPPAATRRAAFARLDEIYVDDAGLVILWPFLERFFGRVDLLGRDRRFANEDAALEAVALLETLATGDPEPPEVRLPLAKVLCGRSPDSDFRPPRALPGSSLAESDRLLAAVIDRADALGNISMPQFRATFLQRAGALSTRDGAWLLQVERWPVDLVLQRLSWSWDWVKLPWMPEPLRVEW